MPWKAVQFSTAIPRKFCENGTMATPPDAPHADAAPPSRIFGRARLVFLLSLVALYACCLIFAWTSRDAMAHLPSRNGQGTVQALLGSQKTIVDLSPWQTAP